MKNLPLQIGNFPEITKYSDEANLAQGFIQLLLKFKEGHHLEINTGKKQIQDFKSTVQKVLVGLKDTLFMNQFTQIWALYKKHNLNFFGVHSDNTRDLLGCFVSKKISEAEVKTIVEEFEYYLELEKKPCRFIIKMFYFLSKIDHFVFQEKHIAILREAIFHVGQYIKDKKKRNQWSGAIGKLFANLVVRTSNPGAGLDAGLQMVVSTVECFINEIYPFEKGHTGDAIFRGALTYFCELVTRKVYYRKLAPYKDKILSVFEPLMLRIVNFGIFRTDWYKFNHIIQSLCLLNKDKFA